MEEVVYCRWRWRREPISDSVCQLLVGTGSTDARDNGYYLQQGATRSAMAPSLDCFPVSHYFS